MLATVNAADGAALAARTDPSPAPAPAPPEVVEPVSLVAAAAPAPAAVPVVKVPASDPPTLREVAVSGFGFVALGAALAVGTGGQGIERVTLALAAGTIGALVLTAPAIAVAHPYLRQSTPVAATVEAVAAGFVAGGRFAWGFAATGLFLAASAPSAWWAVVLAMYAATGVVTVGRAARELSIVGTGAAWAWVISGWVGLTFAIGARLVAAALWS